MRRAMKRSRNPVVLPVDPVAETALVARPDRAVVGPGPVDGIVGLAGPVRRIEVGRRELPRLDSIRAGEALIRMGALFVVSSFQMRGKEVGNPAHFSGRYLNVPTRMGSETLFI